jgi:hypothetical protein
VHPARTGYAFLSMAYIQIGKGLIKLMIAHSMFMEREAA